MADRLWTRNYTLALGVSFFLSLVFYLLMTTMALYAVDEFGAGDAVAGLASSIFVLGAVVVRVGAGVAVDRLGRRRVLLASLVVFAVASLAYFPADGLAALLVARVIHGVAFGMAHTAAGAVVQSLIPATRRAEGTGYLGATTTLATALGPFLAVILRDQQGYDSLFVASSAAAFLALGGALWLQAPQAGPAPQPAGRRAAPIEARALPIASFVLLGAVAYSGVIAFLNPYALSLDLTAAAAAFFLVYAAVVLVLRPVIGRLQDRRGDDVVMYPSIAAFAAGLALLAAARGSLTLLLAAGLLGLGWGTILSAGQAVAVTKAPITRVGTVVATYFLMLDLGMGLGPILLGLLVEELGYRWMYLALAGLTLLSTVVYRAVHGGARARGRSGEQAVTA